MPVARIYFSDAIISIFLQKPEIEPCERDEMGGQIKLFMIFVIFLLANLSTKCGASPPCTIYPVTQNKWRASWEPKN